MLLKKPTCSIYFSFWNSMLFLFRWLNNGQEDKLLNVYLTSKGRQNTGVGILVLSHWEAWIPHSAHSFKVIYISSPEIPECCVCTVCESVCLYQHYKCWLQQRRPVETESWLKDRKMRMLRKASRGREKRRKNREQLESEREERWSLGDKCCGGFHSHRAAGAESGWSTGECWPRWSCNFLSVVRVGFAPAERHPETQLLTLSEAQAS